MSFGRYRPVEYPGVISPLLLHVQIKKMGKRSRSTTELTVDNSAAFLADSWLEGMGSSKKETEDELGTDSSEKLALNQPRPPRLGLGAKFCPHTKSLSEKAVSDSLIKSKQKTASDFIFRAKSRADSDDENESRTKIIRKQKVLPNDGLDEVRKSNSATEEINLTAKKKTKKKKKKHEECSEEIVPSTIEMPQDAKDDDDAARSIVNTIGISAIRAEELARRPPRRRRIKGKKTRSKQKNLKKDNRPEHLKPGFQKPPDL